MNEKDLPIKTGLVGEYKDEVIYCNEKEYKGKGFLFRCGIGCEHYPLLKPL